MPSSLVMTHPEAQIGLLIGGKSRRMSGFPKGLLPHPTAQGTLIEHLCGLADELSFPCVLVGNQTDYQHLAPPIIQDAFTHVGPMGGIIALLQYATSPLVIAVACDLPYLQAPLISALIAKAHLHADAPAVMPLRPPMLEPTCAVYRPSVALPSLTRSISQGRHGLQRWARQAGAVALEIPAEWSHWLDDWDAPEDIDLTAKPPPGSR